MQTYLQNVYILQEKNTTHILWRSVIWEDTDSYIEIVY